MIEVVDIDLFPNDPFPIDYANVEQFRKFLVRSKSIKGFSGCNSEVDGEGMHSIASLGSSKLHFDYDPVSQYLVRRQGWTMTLVVNDDDGYTGDDVLKAVKKAAILAQLDVEVSLTVEHEFHD